MATGDQVGDFNMLKPFETLTLSKFPMVEFLWQTADQLCSWCADVLQHCAVLSTDGEATCGMRGMGINTI